LPSNCSCDRQAIVFARTARTCEATKERHFQLNMSLGDTAFAAEHKTPAYPKGTRKAAR